MYVLALAVVPCNETGVCQEEGTIHTEMSAETDTHEEENPDSCTPFCICTCCSTHLKISTASALVAKDRTHNSQFISFYVERPSLTYRFGIWQPPRV